MQAADQAYEVESGTRGQPDTGVVGQVPSSKKRGLRRRAPHHEYRLFRIRGDTSLYATAQPSRDAADPSQDDGSATCRRQGRPRDRLLVVAGRSMRWCLR